MYSTVRRVPSGSTNEYDPWTTSPERVSCWLFWSPVNASYRNEMKLQWNAIPNASQANEMLEKRIHWCHSCSCIVGLDHSHLLVLRLWQLQLELQSEKYRTNSFNIFFKFLFKTMNHKALSRWPNFRGSSLTRQKNPKEFKRSCKKNCWAPAEVSIAMSFYDEFYDLFYAIEKQIKMTQLHRPWQHLGILHILHIPILGMLRIPEQQCQHLG